MKDFVLIALKILAVLALVLLNGFFVAAEFSLVRIRETQLDTLVAKNWRRARMARHIVRNLNSYLSATQLGITMVSLGLGYLGEPIFSSLLTPVFGWFGMESSEWIKTVSLIVGFSVLTFLSVVAGELAPKWLTIQKPLPIALWSAYPLHWFYIALYPFNRLLNHAARFLLEKIGISPDEKADGAHSEEELRLVLASAQNTAGGRNIVLNSLDLRHRVVREVMRPRQEIVAFNSEATIAECLAIAEKTRYSRYPLCEGGNLDKTLGVVHIKSLYALRDKAQIGGASGFCRAEIDLRSRIGAAGKIDAAFSRTETAFRLRRGRIRRHAGNCDAGKCARSVGRPDSGRV